MKIKTLVPILLGFVLAAGIGVYAYQKNAPGKEEYMAAAIAYLEEQKTALDGAETIPMDIDWATGRVIRIHADSPYTIDRIISYLTNVTEVCRVEDIPELAYPLVYVGDKISGNNEKLYYSADKKILEFTLRNGQPCVPSLSHRERLTIPRDQGVLYRGRDSTTSK